MYTPLQVQETGVSVIVTVLFSLSTFLATASAAGMLTSRYAYFHVDIKSKITSLTAEQLQQEAQ